MRIIIIGGGPTGLGAAWRLHELQQTTKLAENVEWTLLESSTAAGGLASSVVDDAGFTWDLGGHVIFSHYKYFTQLLDALHTKYNVKEREAWVWLKDRFVPYPLQNNLWRLPIDDVCACVDGLIDVAAKPWSDDNKPKDFQEWLERGFGKQLVKLFMEPYNFKVWAYPLKMLGTSWVGERVATVNLQRIIRNTLQEKDDVGWGPNSTFRFPVKGGTGSIWSSLLANLPKNNVKTNKTVVAVDSVKKQVVCADHSVYEYDALISTMPLDLLCKATQIVKNPPKLLYSSTHVIGFGIEGPTPAHLKTKCWMYFSEPNCPFYRATVFSNYADNHVPSSRAPSGPSSRAWSLMCEVSESVYKPVDSNTIVQETEAGCLATKLIAADHKIVSRFHKRLDYGYPTPFYGREQVCEPVFKALEAVSIYSRGRFGAWNYAVSNQDHSLMQGVEVVDHILTNSVETTFWFPSVVNGKHQNDRSLLLMPKPDM